MRHNRCMDRIRLPGRRAAGTVLLTILGLLFWALPAVAHPPTALSLAYHLGNRTLTVQITHAVASPGSHFITRVTIARDGIPLTAVDYTGQPGQATFAYSYPVDAVVGTVLEVTATCNLFGSRTEKLTVIQVPIRVSALHR